MATAGEQHDGKPPPAVAPATVAEAVRSRLAAFAECRLAILFGSLATGRIHRESDADVAIWWAQPMTSAVRENLIGEIALATGRPVDLIDLRRKDGHLLRRILDEGTVLIERDPGLRGELLCRYLAWKEDFEPHWRRINRARIGRFLKTGTGKETP